MTGDRIAAPPLQNETSFADFTEDYLSRVGSGMRPVIPNSSHDVSNVQLETYESAQKVPTKQIYQEESLYDKTEDGHISTLHSRIAK